jgi:tetratricopeptide (TPR) repeat protein
MNSGRVRSLVFLLLLSLVIGGVQAANASTASDYYATGNDLVNQGKLEDALAAFKTAESMDAATLNQEVGLSYQMGWVLNQLGKYDEAYAELVKAEQNHPDWISSYNIFFNEGCVLAKLGRNEEANQKFDQAIAIEGTNREVWFNKGLVLARLGRYDEAAEAFEKSRKAYGSFVPLLGSYREAANTYDLSRGIVHTEPLPEPAVTKSVSVQTLPKPTYNPSISIDLQMKKGSDYSARYLYEDAVQAYDQVLANEPSNYRAMEAKGVALANLGRFDEALLALNQASLYLDNKADPATYIDAWYVKGWVLANLGKYDEALDAFNKVVATDPDAFAAYYNKAWVLGKKGDTNGAVTAYDRSLSWDRPQQLEIKSYAILGPVGTYGEAADAIDKTVRERIIYQTDFSTDPGWQSSNARDYYWDAQKQMYHFAGNENVGFADVPVPYDKTSFRLEYDITIPRADPGTAVHTGLSSHNTTYATTDAIYGEFRSWKAGTFKDIKDGDKTYQVLAVSNSARKTNDQSDYICQINPEEATSNNTFGTNRIYHVIVDYDVNKGIIGTKVTDNLHEKTYSNCAGVYNNVGTFPTLNQIILSGVGAPNQNIEGYLDNVKLYATGLGGTTSSSRNLKGATSTGIIPGKDAQAITQNMPSSDSIALPALIVLVLLLSGGGFIVYRMRKNASKNKLLQDNLSVTEYSKDLIFISAKSEDYTHARQVYSFLIAHGYSVFFSDQTLPHMGNTDYRKEIDRALESAKHLIVVTSRKENVESKWVEAEWGSFINEKRSGRKNGNILILIAGTMQIEDLPISLRSYETRFLDNPKTLDQILHYLT